MIDLENIKKDIVNRVLVSSGKRTIHNEVMHGLGLIEELYQAEIKELKQKLARYENPAYVLVPKNQKTVVAIENMVWQQVEASGIDEPIHRLDGWRILDAMIEAVEKDNAEN